jgi:hypothetical protein
MKLTKEQIDEIMTNLSYCREPGDPLYLHQIRAALEKKFGEKPLVATVTIQPAFDVKTTKFSLEKELREAFPASKYSIEWSE